MSYSLSLFPIFLHLPLLFIILLFAFLNWSRFLHQPLFRKPLQLYSCQWLNAAKPFSLPADPSLAHPQPVSNVSPTKVSFPPIVPPYLNSLPIALHKGKHGCISHPICNFVSYEHLSLSLCAFTAFVSSVIVPKSVKEALLILN